MDMHVCVSMVYSTLMFSCFALLIDALMQIWKSASIFVFVWKHVGFIKWQNLSTTDFTCVIRFFIIMEDIIKFFRSSSKKRDLSDTSKTDKDPKKLREASSASFTD